MNSRTGFAFQWRNDERRITSTGAVRLRRTTEKRAERPRLGPPFAAARTPFVAPLRIRHDKRGNPCGRAPFWARYQWREKLMFLKSTVAIAAALGLAAAPVAAAAAPASKLSLAGSARVGADAGDEELAGGSGAIIALILVAGIIAIPVIDAIQNDSNNDRPTSP
jgi:hypothetical protein